MGEDKGTIHLGGGHHLIMQTSQTVTMKDVLRLFKNGKVVEMEVEIKADFEKVPSEYHQTLLHMLTAKYGSVVNIHDNTDPFEIEDAPEKRWYQFWK